MSSEEFIKLYALLSNAVIKNKQCIPESVNTVNTVSTVSTINTINNAIPATVAVTTPTIFTVDQEVIQLYPYVLRKRGRPKKS